MPPIKPVLQGNAYIVDIRSLRDKEAGAPDLPNASACPLLCCAVFYCAVPDCPLLTVVTMYFCCVPLHSSRVACVPIPPVKLAKSISLLPPLVFCCCHPALVAPLLPLCTHPVRPATSVSLQASWLSWSMPPSTTAVCAASSATQQTWRST